VFRAYTAALFADLAGVEVTWTWAFGAVILLFLSSLVTTSDFLTVLGSCLVVLLFFLFQFPIIAHGKFVFLDTYHFYHQIMSN